MVEADPDRLADVDARAPGPDPARKTLPIVAAITLIAFLLRVWSFWKPELWIDEYGTWWVVAGGSLREVTHRAIDIQGQSPLFYWIVRLSVALFGENAFALRIPSVLAGTAVVFVGWRIAARVFNDARIALVALVVLATNKDLLHFSQDARPYSLAILFASCSFYSFLKLAERWTARDAVLYAISSAAVFYAHYIFTVALLVQAVYVLLRSDLRRAWQRWMLLGAGVALLCIPGLPQLLHLFSRRDELNWIAVEGATATLRHAWEMILWFVDPIVLGVGLLAAVVTGSVRGALRSKRPRALWGLLLLWLLFPILFLTVVPRGFGVALLTPRYLSWIAPAIALLTGGLLALGSRSAISRWLPLSAFLLAVGALEFVPTFRRSGTFADHVMDHWRAATEFLESRVGPQERVFFATGFVEADLTSGATPDPTLLSFVSWPVRANLHGERVQELLSLPARRLNFVDQRVEQLGASVPKGGRFWAIGRGLGFTMFRRRVLQQMPVRLAEKQRFGAVLVLCFERTGP